MEAEEVEEYAEAAEEACIVKYCIFSENKPVGFLHKKIRPSSESRIIFM